MAAFAKSFCSLFLRSSTSVGFSPTATLSTSHSAWSSIKVLHPFSVTKSSTTADPLDLAETGRSPFLHAAAATRAEQPRQIRSLIALRSPTAFHSEKQQIDCNTLHLTSHILSKLARASPISTAEQDDFTEPLFSDDEDDLMSLPSAPTSSASSFDSSSLYSDERCSSTFSSASRSPSPIAHAESTHFATSLASSINTLRLVSSSIHHASSQCASPARWVEQEQDPSSDQLLLAEQGQADPLSWRFKSPGAYYAPHLACPKPDRDEPWCAPAFVEWGEKEVEAWARGEGI